MFSFILFAFVATSFALNQTACKAITDAIGGASDAVVEVDTAFACINSFAFTNASKYEIVEGFAKIIEAYAFTDILKSPPQPYSNETYYETVDLHAELKTLNETSHDSFYSLFSDLFKIITKTRDGHVYCMLKDSGNN